MSTIRKEREDFLETLRIGRRDPVRFINGLLPDHKPEPWQEITLRSIWNNPRTAVVCCNGAGKTHVAAQAVLSFVLTHSPSIVVTTAGSWTQVKFQLWKELRSQYFKLPSPYRLGEIHSTQWPIGDKWYAIGFSTKKPNLFEGFHAPYVLVVLDEAKSIPPEIYAAVDRIFSGKTKIARALQLSTPGNPHGKHYDAFHDKAHRWARIHVNRYEASYSLGEDSWRIPPTEHVSEEFAREMLEEYGEDNLIYRSMILGLWTQEDEFRFFSVNLLDSMRRPPPEYPPDYEDPEYEEFIDPVEYMGCDVARSVAGDESVFYHSTDYHNRAGDTVSVIKEFEVFHTADSSVYRDRLKKTALEWNVPPRNINIDGVGIGGPVCDELRREGWAVNEIQSGAGSDRNAPRLANVRTELHYDVAEKARKGLIYGLSDERTVAQLSEVMYRYNSRDEMQAEPKDVMRDRLRRSRVSAPWHSTDRSDALLYSLRRIGYRRVSPTRMQGA